jgi:nanoRNase/pAp phosphatase (c-di-AMP/oligoRNAs hydrolase)
MNNSIDIREFDTPTDFLCIYHKDCADGFTGAWIVQEWAKENNHAIEYYGSKYGLSMDWPPINRRHVIMIDFSFKKDELKKISEYAASITILDHHKTAEEELKGIESKLYCPSNIIFDMEQAGCEIAWNFFNKDKISPNVVANIADRDLWNFNLPNTKKIASAVFSYEYNFANWDYIMNPNNYRKLLEEGKTLCRKQDKDVRELFNAMLDWETIKVENKTYKVPVFNVPYFYSSDLSHYTFNKMDVPFVICWYFDTAGHYKYSLRSKDQNDVSEIAKVFGGGGHKNAAGFQSEKLIWEK